MASTQMLVTMTASDLETLLQRAVLAALSGKTVPSAPSSSAPSIKKAKKEKDPDAPKKEPNDWIKFTSSVRAALKAANIKTGVEVTQFCGMLGKELSSCRMLQYAALIGKPSDAQALCAAQDQGKRRFTYVCHRKKN